MALTATATPKIIAHTKKLLNLNEPKMLVIILNKIRCILKTDQPN